MLHSIHILFPLLILFVLPKGKTFLQAKLSRPEARPFRLSAGLVLSALFGLAVIAVSSRESLGAIDHVNQIFFPWFWLLIPSFHAMRQSMGFSLIFSKSLGLTRSASEVLRIKAFDRMERRLHWSIIGLTLTAFVVGKTEPLKLGLCVMALSCVAYLLYRIAREPMFRSTYKLVFALRFLLWPLGPYSQVAMWTIVLTHSTEYLALLLRCADLDGEAHATRKRLWIAGGCGALAILTFASIDLISDLSQRSYEDLFTTNLGLTLLLAVYPFLIMLHYVVDAVIYRMSDPDVAASLGGLVIGFHPAARKNLTKAERTL
ncbi:MAG TPA: hypothetical protein PKC28_14035 [Bdellovibrionales bacterium]|nr:hypothetical protein [Bdellovibrionales bacterium]